MIFVEMERLLPLFLEYQGKHREIVEELRQLCDRRQEPIAVGLEKANRLFRVYELRLKHLSDLGVEVVGGSEFLEFLHGFGAGTVGMLGVSDDVHSYVAILGADLRELVAPIRLPVNNKRNSADIY